ncbi:MAG: hypothetical protein ACOC22_00315 [bacterium]
METNTIDLKLIYVLKIGYNSKGEGLYEFIFSEDETNIDIEGWFWDISPACDNAMPPTEDYISSVFNLKTNSFDLFCLHDAVDREYMHGYHTIHALAYEVEKSDETMGYEKMFERDVDEDTPLLVFHYGMNLQQVTDLLEERKFILKGNSFIETSSIKFV